MMSTTRPLESTHDDIFLGGKKEGASWLLLSITTTLVCMYHTQDVHKYVHIVHPHNNYYNIITDDVSQKKKNTIHQPFSRRHHRGTTYLLRSKYFLRRRSTRGSARPVSRAARDTERHTFSSSFHKQTYTTLQHIGRVSLCRCTNYYHPPPLYTSYTHTHTHTHQFLPQKGRALIAVQSVGDMHTCIVPPIALAHLTRVCVCPCT